MALNTLYKNVKPIKRWQTHNPIQQNKQRNPTKLKMKRCTLSFITTLIILASLPYSSTLSLPSGDPAPGRSPGPPNLDNEVVNVEDGTEKATNAPDLYDETTTNDDVLETTVSDSSERTIGDACAFARIPSDSDEIVTISERDSDVNLTVSHPVFETSELVRGVVYDDFCLIASGYDEYRVTKKAMVRLKGGKPSVISNPIEDSSYLSSIHRLGNYKLFEEYVKQFEEVETTTTEKNDIKAITKMPMRVEDPDPHLPKRTPNQIKMRKDLRDLKMFLEKKSCDLSNIGADEIDSITRRFDSITSRRNDTRRVRYDQYVYTWQNIKIKRTTKNLMAQFVYGARYKLVYPQVIRKKYLNITKYKIGFAFAILKELRKQQMLLMHTFRRYYKRVNLVFFYMKLSEKNLRLSVDIEDVIHLIKGLHRQQLLEVYPNYFDYEKPEVDDDDKKKIKH